MPKPTYQEARREANRLYPHLSSEMRDEVARHIEKTHPGFSESMTLEERNDLLRTHSSYHIEHNKAHKYIFVVLAAIIILLIMLLFGMRLSAQSAPLTDKNSPITVIPLTNEDKLKVREVQFKQDKLIIQLKDLQKQEDETLKQIQGMNDQINQIAQDMAKEQQIDTQSLVLDLDKLAWVTKGASK